MAKDEAPPRFIKPGDDPEVDALLARLQKDGEHGDPLYVDYRKRLRERARHQPPQGATEADAPAPSDVAAGASASAASTESEDTAAPIAGLRPAEPQPVELPAARPPSPKAPAHTASSSARATPSWLRWGAFAITAPIVAIGIGSLWSLHRGAQTPNAAASATATVTPSAASVVAPTAAGSASAGAAASVVAPTAAPSSSAGPAQMPEIPSSSPSEQAVQPPAATGTTAKQHGPLPKARSPGGPRSEPLAGHDAGAAKPLPPEDF